MKTSELKYCPGLSRLFPFCLFILITLVVLGCGKKEESQGKAAQTSGKSAQTSQIGQMMPEVAVVAVAPESVPVTVETTGKTESFKEVEVRAQVTGTLLKRAYVEGSVVKKGDLLFQLDPTPFQTTVNQVKAMVTQRQASVNKADRDIERLKPLLAEKAVAQKEYDDALSSKEEATAALESANASLQQAEINLNYTRITAPISGITGKTLKDEGSLVSAGTDSLLTKVYQVDPIYVNYSTADTDYLTMRREMDEKTLLMPEDGNIKIELTLSDGSVYPRIGKMNFRETLVDQQTGTIQSRAQFANPDSALMPNQFVRVTMKGAVRPNSFLVPQRAVLQGQAGHYLYVVDKAGKIEQRMVETGDWVGDNWIIKSGLSTGDTVVVDGTIKIRPGVQVKTVPAGGTSSSPVSSVR
jgi:membrane fusion protein, multidrug efflux system